MSVGSELDRAIKALGPMYVQLIVMAESRRMSKIKLAQVRETLGIVIKIIQDIEAMA